MKNNKLIYIAIILSIFIFLIIYFKNNIYNYIIDRSTSRIDTVLVSDTIWKLDSVKIIKPITKYVEKVKIDTVYNDKGDTIQLITENKKYQNTITTCAGDTMEVTSYISGINAALDSLKVNLSKQEIIKTEIITKYITPKKKFLDRFHFGLQAGYGYGFKSKELTPYVGIGGSIDL